MSISHRPSRPHTLLCGSHGTTAVAHQALPVVTAPDVHLCVCVRVRVMFPVGTNTEPEERCKDAAKGAERHKPTLPRDLKPTAKPRVQQQQRCSSSTTAQALRTLPLVTATVLLCSNVCAVFTRIYLYMHPLHHDHL